MKNIVLKKLIYGNYLKTTLTSIFFIEIALIFLYFYSNSYMVDKNIKFLLNDIRVNVYEKVRDIKSHIKTSLSHIEQNVKFLHNEHQQFFKYIHSFDLYENVEFERASNGMFYKKENNGGSSLVVSKNTTINKDLKDELNKTESFDKNLKLIVNQNDMIVAGYFNSRHNYSRYYPFLENSFNVFPVDIQMKNYSFYYKADLKHNPNKELVWTDVYLDPAGQGWMMSAIVPIYKDNVLEGVTGVDITVDKIIETLLSIELPYEGSSFLVDKKGEIIARTDAISDILELDSLQNYPYKIDEKIDATISKKDNIFRHKNKDFIDNIKKVLNNLKYNHDVILNNEDYLLFTEKIDKTSWYLISLIKKDNILIDAKELENYYKNLGYIIIAFVVLFYFMFFLYLYKKAKDFVDVINTPLEKIIELTKNLGNKKSIKRLESCGIVEIDKLNKNFNILADELEHRTKKLIEVEASRAFHEQLSNTDVLTGAYNRRFLEDFSKKYFEIVKRENGNFSILVIDIDDFKDINDTHGHDMGDYVLKELVKNIEEKIRENDFIVRLGGDEFVVVLPNIVLDEARIVANKLIDKINSDKKDINFTISIGSASYIKDDISISTVIKRADEALYEAKNLGKNTIV